ncbi:hypothetical protein J2Z48_002318 [Croceifilum oryzae]|uniref:Uncharacterized protein n=1 Tax=Croceifilum oryzae TaxID=1553429 RepID=A0AAJ1TL46_9BACL|nr:hypothetical protein [Croceifilum oryzae]MDQ0418129.1 hypothetical protein [Croceifilum oryzae]
MNHTEGHIPLTATRYTLYSWVLFLLPLTFGVLLASIYDWSDFWVAVVIGLGCCVLVNNIIVVMYQLYTRRVSILMILGQVYVACFFGIMFLGKAYVDVRLEFVLMAIFAINALLGVMYRKNLLLCGWCAKVILLFTVGFPFVFAQIAYTYGWSSTMDAPGLMSSIAAAFTYYTGSLLNNNYYFPS